VASLAGLDVKCPQINADTNWHFQRSQVKEAKEKGMMHSAAHSLTMKLPHNQEEEGELRNHELAQRKER
jgi:hypothetical protein